MSARKARLGGDALRQVDALLARVQAGDTEARSELVRRYEPMARKVAGQFFAIGYDHADLCQEAMIGVWLAVGDWQPDRTRGSFSNFAALCARRRVMSLVTLSRRRKYQPMAGYQPMHQLTEAGWDMAEPDEWDDDFDVRETRANNLWRAMRTLTPLEVEVMRRWMVGESYAEMASDLGLKVRSVDNAVQRSKRKLREVLVAA